jgi:hypothetical protein
MGFLPEKAAARRPVGTFLQWSARHPACAKPFDRKNQETANGRISPLDLHRCFDMNSMSRPPAMDNYDLLQAVRDGTVATLPPDMLTPERLVARNASGTTPLHAAAKRGSLH